MKESKAHLLQLTQKYSSDFEMRFAKVEHVAQALEGILRSTISPEIFTDSLRMDAYEAKNIPLYLGVAHQLKPKSFWIIFNPKAMKGIHTISYIDTDNDGVYEKEAEYSVYDYDLNSAEMKWWTEGIKHGSYWTKPYFWENWNSELITYAKAVTYNGKVICVLGSDFDFSEIKKQLGEIKLYSTGYLWLLDKDLNFIYHPHFQGKSLSELKDENLNVMFDKIQNSDNSYGVMEYKFQGKSKLMAWNMMNNGWIIGASPVVDEIYRNVDRTFRTILLLVFVGIAISVFVAWILGRAISRPIGILVGKFREGIGGNLKVQVEIDTKDEFRELGIYFNKFMLKQQQMVTELRDLNRHYLEAKDKAEESDRLKSAFLANISHEIRTPLNSIMGFSELMKDPNLTFEKRSEYADIVFRKGTHLVKVIDNIILFAKLESDQVRASFAGFALNDVLYELFNHFYVEQIESGNSKLRFYVHTPLKDKDSILVSDRDKLVFILRQYIDNAFKFTSTGTVELGYYLDLKGAKDYLVVFVKDSGIGIADEKMELLFTKFQQIDYSHTRLFEGTGIGLAISKKMSALIGGEVGVVSTLGEGSEFFIKIPYIKSLDN